MEALIEKLKALGLNSYEAKVYLALLKRHPATGYEISKDSGVPQARAYDTLKVLETQQVVVSLGGKPTTYMPVSPAELLDRWERNTQDHISFLRQALPSLHEETVEPVLNLQGIDSIWDYAADMLRQAKDSVFLELWQEDAVHLEPSLKAAQERGVALKIVGYNQLAFPFCDVYQHALAQAIENQMGGRWLILSVDDQVGLAGSVSVLQSGRKPHAVYTRNPEIVLIIKELIVHDIFLLDVEEHLREPMEAVYGKNLTRLREKVLGNTAGIGGH